MKLIFYSHHARKLQGTIGDKVNAFLAGEPDERYIDRVPGISERMGCVAYSKDTKAHYVLPLKGYNTRVYEIKHDKTHRFRCNCQGWVKSLEIWTAFLSEMETIRPLMAPGQFEHLKARLGTLGRIRPPICSHVATIYEYYARKNQVMRECRVSQAMLTMFEAYAWLKSKNSLTNSKPGYPIGVVPSAAITSLPGSRTAGIAKSAEQNVSN